MNIITAHQYSSLHRNTILRSKQCGCFYCLKIFFSKEIVEWCDNEQTALCPYCGVDSLIGDVDINFDKDFLKQMHKLWF